MLVDDINPIYIYRKRERERERERESYTQCNLTRVTPFVDRRFVIDLMVKKIVLNAN